MGVLACVVMRCLPAASKFLACVLEHHDVSLLRMRRAALPDACGALTGMVHPAASTLKPQRPALARASVLCCPFACVRTFCYAAFSFFCSTHLQHCPFRFSPCRLCAVSLTARGLRFTSGGGLEDAFALCIVAALVPQDVDFWNQFCHTETPDLRAW